LCSRLGARAALFGHGGQSAYRPREGPKRRTREGGESMGADKNSIQEFGL
jgi:hypothetical protein